MPFRRLFCCPLAVVAFLWLICCSSGTWRLVFVLGVMVGRLMVADSSSAWMIGLLFIELLGGGEYVY